MTVETQTAGQPRGLRMWITRITKRGGNESDVLWEQIKRKILQCKKEEEWT